MRTAKKPRKLTRQQMQVEEQAVRLLKQAIQLVEADDTNVERARELRHYVVHELLPEHNMVIQRKNPRSLLLDLDRRIQRASLRRALNGNRPSKVQAAKKVQASQREMQRRARYATISQKQNQQVMRNAVGFICLIILLVAAVMTAKHVYGPEMFYQSFDFLPR